MTDFPPEASTSLKQTIRAYPYKQFEDDQYAQAFFAAYNGAAQDYVDVANANDLALYVDKDGPLLDWVGTALYGIPRPSIYSSKRTVHGPYDTTSFNMVSFDKRRIDRPFKVDTVTDDVYKRVLTWHLWRGDGMQVSIPWLKRRIGRFLYAPDGGDYSGPLPGISISSALGTLTITLIAGVRTVTDRSLFSDKPYNASTFGRIRTSVTRNATPPLASLFADAVGSGALEMPAQYRAGVRVGVVFRG